MAVQTRITVEEFDQFVERPENADRLFEYIGGEIVEVPSNPYVSFVAMRIARRLAAWVEDRHLGYVTGEAGGYMVSGERYAPDVAFLAQEKGPLSARGYNPVPPDLAVEVLSPSNTTHEMRVKVVNYLSVGTVVWVVDLEFKLVEVYLPGRAVKKVRLDEILDGGDVLPGFVLAVKDIFQE